MIQKREKEVFKDIIGYEGLYQISNRGRVRSLKKEIIKNTGARVVFPKIILKHCFRQGYACVNLFKGKKPRTHNVHRLVAVHFIPNPENKPQVNHINANRADCSILNLEWVTASENAIHCVKLGRSNPPQGSKNGQSKLTEDDVYTIRNSRYKITRKKLSEMFGVTVKHIDRVRCKERWKHI
jgi:hypothetical protein